MNMNAKKSKKWLNTGKESRMGERFTVVYAAAPGVRIVCHVLFCTPRLLACLMKVFRRDSSGSTNVFGVEN
jgi:hypothetical protein